LLIDDHGPARIRKLVNQESTIITAFPCLCASVVDLPFDVLNGCRKWIWGNRVDQSNAQGFGCVDLLGGNKHFERFAFSDQAREPLGPTPTGDKPQCSAPMAQDGVGRGDPPTTRERQVQASAEAVTLNRGIDWSGKAGDRIHEMLTHFGEFDSFRRRKRSDFRQVCAGGEELRISGNDERLRIS
jgi:hypothetical protein